MPSGRHESLGEQKLTPQGQVFEVRPEATRESCVESGELDVTDDENDEIESMRVDCKTVGFFLKISKEVGNAWRKSLMRANRASLTRP